MNPRTFIPSLALATVLLSLPAAGQTGTEPGNSSVEDDGPVIDVGAITDPINDLITEFNQFAQNWDDKLAEILTEVFFDPFRSLLESLVLTVADVMLHTPAVISNSAVQEVHGQALIVTILLASLVFMVAGILHMIGPILGVAYKDVRMILPRVIVALVFATISLPLLQYSIDLTDALVAAFRPEDFGNLGELFGVSVSLFLVAFINAWLLLGVVLIFVIRAVYILFIAAISPLIALAWSMPKAKRYADSFIAGWFTALAMAPLDMLVLKFSFELMSINSFGVDALSTWVYGTASAVLLILVPYQVYGASQAIVGQAYSITRSIKNGVQKHRSSKRRKKYRKERKQYWERQERKRDQYREERLKHLRGGRDPAYRSPSKDSEGDPQ